MQTHFHSSAAVIPECGQLVEIRRRQWVVKDIQGSSLHSHGKSHIVTLSSLDEDALGEELQVAWEVEPGARVLDSAGMPVVSGLDDDATLGAFLDAVRWGAITNADRSFLQAPFRSGITIEDYQLDPLVRAVDMARANLLIADDVGLGKTIEAGLVVQELLVRHRARTVLVVCPASLQRKWQVEMWDKFGLEFRVVNTDYIKQLRRERGIHANPWTSFPRLITSMDWAKSGEGLRLLKDCLPQTNTYPRRFDILIVDEAHNVAPSTATQYAIESQRTRLIRTIGPHFEHRLFLSATPHNGYQESFTSLLELLDDQRFARSVMPDEKQLQRVMIRRLKTDIVNSEGKQVYPSRRLLPLEITYTEEEREAHRLLRQLTESRSESVSGTAFRFGSVFTHKLLKKRLFSSPLAFSKTLSKYRSSLDNPKSADQDKRLDDRILKKAIMKAEEDFGDDNLYEAAQEEAIEEAGKLTVPLTEDQRRVLDKLLAWAERSQHKSDSKSDAVLRWVEQYLKDDGEWTDKRVILFTEFRATHVWMEQLLTAHGYGGERLMTIHGGTDHDEREKIKAAFQADPSLSPVRILLATDAASEGIDLQNHCNYMIHIEIPWNPNVMEQRNGRIDRHGQRESEVHIWHPVGSGFDLKTSSQITEVGKIEGDHEYLMRAVLKVETIREDLGSVGPVIAQQIEEAMLGKRQDMNTHQAEDRAAGVKRFVAAERTMQEKTSRLHERLMEAKTDFHLSPEYIHRAVSVALTLAEKPSLQPTSLCDVPDGSVFHVPDLPGSWGRATAGLEHPYTGVRRPITFDHEVAKGRDDVVLAHLNHRLVQMCLRLLREELWSLDDAKKLHRVIVKKVDDSLLDGPAVIVWSRLVITGGDHHRLHEEITISGGELKHGSFARIPQVGRLQALLDTGQIDQPSDRLFAVLADRFKQQEPGIRAAMNARSKDRLRFLENTLGRRRDSDIQDLTEVLDELARTIQNELADDSELQKMLLPGFYEFFNAQEQTQVRRNIQSLQDRLARIPKEKEQEIEVIRNRYSDLTDRTFPVAVAFVVPKSQMRGASYA